MKTRIISIILILSLFSTVSVSATDITFEDFIELENENYISFEDIESETSVSLDNKDIIESNFSKAIDNTFDMSIKDDVINQDIPKINMQVLSKSTKTMFTNIDENLFNNLNYTIINLTDLATGEVATHDCNRYLTTNFDEDNHWQECSICGKIIDLVSHNYVDNGWTGGSINDCNENNVHQFICECGSSYSNTIGRKTHTYGSVMNNTASYFYYRQCSGCKKNDILHNCIKSDGSRISCGNPGKCSLCGYNYTAYHVGRVWKYDTSLTESVYCDYCSKYLGDTIYNMTCTSDGYLTLYNSVSINGNYTSLNTNYINYESKIDILSNTKNNLSQTTKIKYNTYSEFNLHITYTYDYYQNGEHCRIAIYLTPQPEYTPPVITSIETNNINDWSTDSTISISGTENYCNSVKITLKDIDDNIYLENISVPVNNGNWNYEIKPSIEAKENTEFILIVKDALNNKTEQNFYLSKIDNKPPIFINDEEFDSNWSKTKNYIILTTDSGIGQVSNSVNDTKIYELAVEENNTFYKGYTFTGDIYGSTVVSIHSKDGLDNTSTKYIKVYNLDNTSPTIEDIIFDKSLHNTNVTIQANDINTKLNAEGSGITGYAITTNNIEPTDYQESNRFTITESNTYYVWVKDLVGNVTSKEIDVPVQYKVTINPDGGIWKESPEPQEIIISSDEKYDLSPQPTKEGYTFTEWKVTGEGYITDDGELVITGSDVEVIPVWETNQYFVTYIDYDVTNNQSLTETTKQVDYNTTIRGFDLGNDTSDNAYYNQYRLVSDTESKVTISNNTVYRYFEFCYTEKSIHIDFNDNDNTDNLRPENYVLQLQLENGTLVDEVTLSSDVTDYTFEKLPKYDIDGNEYKYLITPIISDRYKVTPNPETGEPEIDYTSPEYSILIPKVTTLDGKTGELSYTLKVNSTLFYHDKIIVTPDDSFTLTDGISTLSANVFQNQTTFTKNDVSNNELIVNGDIQANKKHFAGTWIGTFNFNIKYITEN